MFSVLKIQHGPNSSTWVLVRPFDSVDVRCDMTCCRQLEPTRAGQLGTMVHCALKTSLSSRLTRDHAQEAQTTLWCWPRSLAPSDSLKSPTFLFCDRRNPAITSLSAELQCPATPWLMRTTSLGNLTMKISHPAAGSAAQTTPPPTFLSGAFSIVLFRSHPQVQV